MEKEFTYIINLGFIAGHLQVEEKAIDVKVGETSKELEKHDEWPSFRVQSLTFRYDDEKVDVRDAEAVAKSSVYEEASKLIKDLKDKSAELIQKWDNFRSDRNVHFNCSANNCLEYNTSAYTKK